MLVCPEKFIQFFRNAQPPEALGNLPLHTLPVHVPHLVVQF
jgi:hypothetical protein